jgi:glutamate/tyrosine decarboxylase-like PLP-dependent enzyme
MDLQKKMFGELKDKKIFDLARTYAFSYADNIDEMDVYPSDENLKNLAIFDESIPEDSASAENIISQLNKFGSPATTAQTGGRYFGFVNGGAIPVAVAAKWLADFWDQNGGLYATSPINSKLETICEKWLKEIFNLPEETVAGFVSGTSTANFCGIVAARFRLLKNLGWDVNEKGLNGAPPIRIVTHLQIHSAIKKALALAGFGKANIEWVEADDQGRMILEKMPPLDDRTLLILQAGNANTGSFDHFEKILAQANEANAWVHIDGAFGLWAQACESLKHLTKDMEKATSWSVDGHKTLNTPYDSGIIMCADSEALIAALQATGEYIIYSEQKDPMLCTPEMSKRSRAIELWATMKYLGKNGIDKMVTGFHLHAKQLEKGLRNNGFTIVNEVVFNQVLVSCGNSELTKSTLLKLQKSGEIWCGGSTWKGEAVIRVSVCSWATTEEDIERTIAIFSSSRSL